MSDNSPSRIPTPVSGLRRSASLRVRGERPLIVYSTSPTTFPSISEKEESHDAPHWTPTKFNLGFRSRSQASGLNRRDDDLESIESLGSNISCISRISGRSNCEHSPFARNGTTFSGRTNKYVVHCSHHGDGPDEYLTPTQRANKNIRRLKTLLQLAKEKLMEKEKEIFKLTKEVVELRVFKASIHNGGFSDVSTPSDCKDSPRTTNGEADTATYTVDGFRDFANDTYADLTPIQTSRSFVDKLDSELDKDSPRGKLSPTSPFHGFQRDKMSATPEYFLSSLADSGHFDDLASSLSLQSKDSLNLHVTLPEEEIKDGVDAERDEERARLVNMYETLLTDRRNVYENDLQTVKKAHDEDNLRMIDSFDEKLKEEERKFEEKFRALLHDTQMEKIEIVERFEKKLNEAKEQHLKHMTNGENPVQSIDNDNYLQQIEAEKAVYEQSLAEMKLKFEQERSKIEKSFDDAMSLERNKFEKTVTEIQQESDRKIEKLNHKMTEYEKKYNELLEKYQDSLIKISQLEESNKRLKISLEEQTARQKELYLKMFKKGQESILFENNEVTNEPSTSAIVPVPELLMQLKVTQVELENLKDNEYRSQHKDQPGVCLLSAKEALSLWMLAARKAMYNRLSEAQQPQESAAPTTANRSGRDPEATLQFLKSAVYYFLTDRDNHLEHLRAIERILGFTQGEKRDIAAHYTSY